MKHGWAILIGLPRPHAQPPHDQRQAIAQPSNPNAPTMPTPAPSPNVSSDVAQPCKPQAQASVAANNNIRVRLRITVLNRLSWIMFSPSYCLTSANAKSPERV